MLKTLCLLIIIAIPLAGQCKPLFMGDSLTYRLAISYQNYAAADAHYLEGTGLKSTKRLNWLNYTKQINFHHYDTVYIVLGTNDMISKNEISAYQKKAADLIQSVKQQNTRIIWILPPSLKDPRKNSLLANTREAIERAAEKERILTIDMRQSLGNHFYENINGVQIRTSDGIHLTAKGADKVIRSLIHHHYDN